MDGIVESRGFDAKASPGSSALCAFPYEEASHDPRLKLPVFSHFGASSLRAQYVYGKNRDKVLPNLPNSAPFPGVWAWAANSTHDPLGEGATIARKLPPEVQAMPSHFLFQIRVPNWKAQGMFPEEARKVGSLDRKSVV